MLAVWLDIYMYGPHVGTVLAHIMIVTINYVRKLVMRLHSITATVMFDSFVPKLSNYMYVTSISSNVDSFQTWILIEIVSETSSCFLSPSQLWLL